MAKIKSFGGNSNRTKIMKFPQNLRDRLKKQCEFNNMTMESALQRREEIFQTPKDELVERLANRLLENEIVEDDSEHTLFES